MKKKNDSKKYEEFHKEAMPQKKIINNKNFTYRIILSIINDFLGKSADVLDIGCGVGTISIFLASRGYRVVGIDVAKNAINAAKSSAKILGFQKMIDFEVINFPKEVPDRKFDFIICSEVIEHLVDDDLVVEKIMQLLRKGGIAIISTPSKNAPLYRLGLANHFDKKVGHLRRYSMDELIDKSKKHGFVVLHTEKTEGILRNFLFINPLASKIIRFIKFYFSDLVTFIDNILIKLFGESQLFIVVQKSI